MPITKHNSDQGNHTHQMKLVTGYIIQSLDRYTQEAINSEEFKAARSESEQSNVVVQLLHKRIQEKLASVGVSLDDIIADPKLRESFEQRNRLKAVLHYHQKLNPEHSTSNPQGSESLESIAQKIFDKRDELWQQAMESSSEKAKILLTFVLSVREEFKKENHSPRELFESNNREVFQKFFSSGRLGLAMAIYKQMIAESKPTPPQQEYKKEHVYEKEAHDLAQDAAKREQGLVTRLGVKGLEPAEAKKQARKAMFEEHPDKNPDGDANRFNDAAALMRLIDQGVFDKYEEELDKLRGRGNSPGL